MATRKRSVTILVTCILLFLVAFTLFPYLFMLITSLKNNQQFYASYWQVTFPFHWENYSSAWSHISVYMVNSLIATGFSVLGVLLLASITAFVFARYRFIGREFLFTLIVCLLMVPSIASLIPLFVLIRDLGLVNTRLALILPYIAGGTVFATFLMRTFFQQLPEEIFEAARLDGANGPRMYMSIMLPLSGPIIGTIILLTLDSVWNDYFWPLVTISDDSLRTVTTGLAFLQGQYVTLWGPLFAGYVVASIPLLLVFAFSSRYLLAGIAGAVGEVRQ